MQNFSSKTVVIAELIKNRRKAKKISSQEMAKILGVHIRTYQRREAGNMTIEELIEILKHLDLTMLIIDKDHII